MSSELNFPSAPEIDDPNGLRVVAIGSLQVVENYVLTQYRLGFAQVHEWSRPLPSSQPGKVIRILTRRVNLDNDP